ncbi:MAG: tRNA lysidine(34) synthetase TilS [Luteimonas sp.]
MCPRDTTSTPDDLPIERHIELHVELPSGNAPVCVGYSGGLDSTVLLHRLAAIPAQRARGLRALHVHHGLHDDADAWSDHCRAVCDALAVPLDVVRVQVAQGLGIGREAAARVARHAAFAEALAVDEILALAHHRNDQAETLLLRALRGSGVDGLAAMRPWRGYARGSLWRPLLGQSRAALQAYATRHGLRWLEDPSNRDDAFDRNFVRHRVLPLLHERWPHADASFARSAALAADAADLLDDGDAVALASAATDDPHTLRVTALRTLLRSRRARALRRWIAALALPPLPAQGVKLIEADLLCEAPNARAAFVWHGAAVRRWRDLLHADAVRRPLPPEFSVAWDGVAPIALPSGDRLAIVAWDQYPQATNSVAGVDHGSAAAHAHAIAPIRSPPSPETPFVVHSRRGGERIVLPGRRHSHALKHLLQELGVPPWQRERLPLISGRDGRLLAAGDLVLADVFDAWLRERDLRVRWIQAGSGSNGIANRLKVVPPR